MTLQTTSDGKVINHTVFGSQLQACLRSDEAFAALGDVGFGFQDGGCRVLAHALTAWCSRHGIVSRIVAVGRPGQQDHIVCAIKVDDGWVYADSDGVATGPEMIEKLARLELTPGAQITDYDPAACDQANIGSLAEEGVPGRLARFLVRYLEPPPLGEWKVLQEAVAPRATVVRLAP